MRLLRFVVQCLLVHPVFAGLGGTRSKGRVDGRGDGVSWQFQIVSRVRRGGSCPSIASARRRSDAANGQASGLVDGEYSFDGAQPGGFDPLRDRARIAANRGDGGGIHARGGP